MRDSAVFRLGLGLLAVVALLGAPTPAKGPEPDAEQARQLVEQLYTPKGVLPIKDMIVELEDNETAEDAPANLVNRAKTKIFYKFPSKLRVDQVHNAPNNSLDGRMTVIIRDGTYMWVYAMGQYAAKKTSDSGQATLALPFDIQKYRKDAEREYHYLGKETMDNIPVHRVQVLNPAVPGWCAVVWIDPERRVPLQLEAAIPHEKDAGKFKSKRVLYKDIRKLEDGRWFPFQIQIFDGEILRQVKLYKGVKVNVGLDETLFQPMKEFYKQ